MPDTKEVDSTTKSLSSVTTESPFQLETSHGRKYVRLDLSSSIQFRLLTCKSGKLRISNKRISAELLNLSQGGMLLITNSSVPDDGFLILTLNLNRLVTLDGILGKIKRVEPSGEEDFLVGVQFSAREELKELTSSEEMRRLPQDVTCFDSKIREIISNYLHTAGLANK